MFKVGIYARLSKEDGDNVQSESIHNQINLIKNYLKNKEDMKEVEVYTDDGFTGLYFENRPDFMRMLTDIKSGKINMVITKDISRLGRESIETSIYLEKYFPIMKVRYVSILDNYDSYTGSNIEMAPFKILFNDMYSKDISRKVRGSFDAKRSKGEFIGSTSPYGYAKSKENNNKLVIDDYAASIVRRIYALYIAGNGKGAIATLLEKDKIPTPSYYKKEILKENYYNPHMSYSKVSWSFQTIHQILTNEVYIGNMVQKRCETISYKVKKKRSIPKEDQIRVVGTHEPIVSKEIFDTVQELLKYRTRSSSGNSAQLNLFAGKLICAECGRTFSKAYDARKKKFIGYVCSQYKKHGNLYCTSHYLNRDEFERLILELIKKEAKKLLKESEIQELNKFQLNNMNENNYDLQIIALKQKIEELKKYKRKAFEKFSDHIIEKEDYVEYINEYEKKIAENSLQVTELKKLFNSKQNQVEEQEHWIDKFKNFIDVDMLTRAMVVELIDKIVVDKDKNIDIYFKFGDRF
ncbi:MAG: recombinase family protein [Lachnotalea sp.]